MGKFCAVIPNSEPLFAWKHEKLIPAWMWKKLFFVLEPRFCRQYPLLVFDCEHKNKNYAINMSTRKKITIYISPVWFSFLLWNFVCDLCYMDMTGLMCNTLLLCWYPGVFLSEHKKASFHKILRISLLEYWDQTWRKLALNFGFSLRLVQFSDFPWSGLKMFWLKKLRT